MKKYFSAVLIFVGFSAFALGAQAQELEPWQKELQSYSDKIAKQSNARVQFSRAFHAAAVVGTCGASGAIVAAQFVADTLPVVNGLAEALPNMGENTYVSVTTNKLLSGDTADLIARGALGGGLLATYESLEFLVYWLQGDTEKIYQATKKMYESTIVMSDKLFAQKGQCRMNISKFVLATAELTKRAQAGVDIYVDPQIYLEYQQQMIMP